MGRARLLRQNLRDHMRQVVGTLPLEPALEAVAFVVEIALRPGEYRWARAAATAPRQGEEGIGAGHHVRDLPDPLAAAGVGGG